MLMPSIFGENLFDDWFDSFPFYDMDKEINNTEKKLYGKKASRIMKTDIKEKKDGYELVVDLPGFKKEDVSVELDKGYLTITAAKGLEQNEAESEEAKKEGRYILEQVMRGGNFGHHDKRLSNSPDGKIGSVWRVIKHNLHLLSHYPADVLWAPVWIVWHWGWKRAQLLKTR